MPGQQEILREYLLSLGVHINKQEFGEFTKHLDIVDGMMLRIGEKLIDAGEQIAKYVNQQAELAISMDTLAQRTRSPVSEIKGLTYASHQLGLNAEALQGALTNLADNLANKHGFDQWLKSLGVKVDGQTPAEMLEDLLANVQKFDPAMQASIWQQIGADPNEMRLFGNHLGEVIAKLKQFHDENARGGRDLDEQNKALETYGKNWRDLENTLSQIGTQYAANLAPVFQDITQWLKSEIEEINADAQHPDAKGKHTLGGFLYWMRDGFSSLMNWKNDANVQAMLKGQPLPFPKKAVPTAGTANPGMTGGPTPGWSNQLEAKWGLPPGILTGIYAQESSNGRDLVSKAGAKGPFGFMDKTAESYNVNQWDFNSSAEGAAHLIHDLLQAYNGDVVKALMAYNMGETQFNRYLRGERLLPKETADYPGYVMSKGGMLGGQPIQQTNHTSITVHGSDPDSTGAAVADAQARVHADQTRNMGALVR